MQASTALTFNFTSFTLSNFTQSFFLNITNVNSTNVVPAGLIARVIVCTTQQLDWHLLLQGCHEHALLILRCGWAV